MRVLVLGASGFIGPHIVRRPLAHCHHVTAFHRGSAIRDTPTGVPLVIGDRNRLDTSAREFRDLQPDIVLDVIPYTEKQAKDLVNTFRGIAKRTIILSSGDVYRANDLLFRRMEGPLDSTPLKEGSPLRDRLYPYRGVPVPPVEGFSPDDYDKLLVERTVLNDPALPAHSLASANGLRSRCNRKPQTSFLGILEAMDDHRPAIFTRPSDGWVARSLGLVGRGRGSCSACSRERKASG